MPRVAGIDIPADKPLWIALTYVHGIGRTQSKKILAELQVNPVQRAREVPEDTVNKINAYIEKNYVVEGALRRQTQQNIQRLKDIRCFRGLRHRANLPVRGQRTRTNSRTRKGRRKTVANKASVKGNK